MKIYVELRDHEDKVHKQFEWNMTEDGEMSELRDQVKLVFSIDHIFQLLLYKGLPLRADTAKEAGMKHKDTCVVIHTLSDNWSAFLAHFELARQALSSNQFDKVQQPVDEALGHLMPLIKAKFLISFPRFDPAYRQFKANFSRFMDQEYKYIELAVKEYFSKYFAGSAEFSTLDIECNKKGPEDEGVQGGLLCRVLRDRTLIGKFYVKEHCGLANWQFADLRELYIYKLFEIISVGPKVHFITNIHHSSFGMYIGTEEVSGFRRADSGSIEISSDIYAQRDLIRRLLCVKDLHSKNYGLNGDGKLCIVDLQVKNNVDPQKVTKYLDGYQCWKGNREQRVQVAKECITLWNLPDNFDKANEAISMQKKLFRKHSISYKPSQNFDDYFNKIKRNLTTLMESLE